VRALPHTYRLVDAKDGTVVALTISGDAGGRWLLRREEHDWRLYTDGTDKAYAEIVIDQEIAWRLFTKGITKDEALKRAAISGDRALATQALEMISVIA
jgi:hypothetical protein